jgi:uncharacterized protein (TIGR03382 family)
MRAALALALLVAPAPAAAQAFDYRPPGDLSSGSGTGLHETTVFAPGMRFPMEQAPAYANSQVWGRGGSQGGGGSQCDVQNFSYPWRDNYCESRSWDMPLCPTGKGHQGQDLRAATCQKGIHWVVAADDGMITNIGSYSVYLAAGDGTRYEYLHMGDVAVRVGDRVARGQRLGKVSNEFGGTPTTVHLHLNIRQNVEGVGLVYVSPYMSLVRSYQALLGIPSMEPGADAGVPPPDAAPRPDAAPGVAAEGDEVAGGCATGGRPAPGAAALVVMVALVLRSARRRG